MSHSFASDFVPPARRIVVIDDDQAILDVVAAFIRLALGAQVRCFDSPVEALRDFKAHPEDCTLVITDFEMPGMNGCDLVRAMREEAPDIEAIVFSGHAEEEIREIGLPPNCRYLAKTGGFPKLIEAVQEMAVAA